MKADTIPKRFKILIFSFQNIIARILVTTKLSCTIEKLILTSPNFRDIKSNKYDEDKRTPQIGA